MLIIPAIDLKGGKCVRLEQGRMDAATVYSDKPVDVAKKWEAAGARLIHLVDLDGAIAGKAKNTDVIKAIRAAVKCEIQVGGGIRDEQTASMYLNSIGAKRVILGTAAFENPALVMDLAAKYQGRITVGIDAKNGFVAIKGWVNVTNETAVNLAKKLEGEGVAGIVYTDISRDGMMTGPNAEATKTLAEAISIPVIASGGISSLKDVEAYKGAPIAGIIIGRALYTGDIDLKEAIGVARKI